MFKYRIREAQDPDIGEILGKVAGFADKVGKAQKQRNEQRKKNQTQGDSTPDESVPTPSVRRLAFDEYDGYVDYDSAGQPTYYVPTDVGDGVEYWNDGIRYDPNNGFFDAQGISIPDPNPGGYSIPYAVTLYQPDGEEFYYRDVNDLDISAMTYDEFDKRFTNGEIQEYAAEGTYGYFGLNNPNFFDNTQTRVTVEPFNWFENQLDIPLLH